jgi:DNA-binding NtrC family response regulator
MATTTVQATAARREERPVVLVVDDLRTSFETLVQRVSEFDRGRLTREFDFEYVGSYDELKDWYDANRERFVSLIVQDVDFSHVTEEGRLVGYPTMLKAMPRSFDTRALQGFLIHAYLRQNNIDRISPVVFVSCRVGVESTREFSEFIAYPGYGNCSFVPETAVGDQYYPRIIESIDTMALRPMDAERRRAWREAHEMVIGRARKMAFLAHEIERIGRSDAVALLLGGPGSGKELVACALHRASYRFGDGANAHPLTVNMAALDKNLIEDELFGHEKGAFTGAVIEREGIFEAAKGSSVFLDEIGDIGQDIQVKLLRAMEYHWVKRLGSSKEIEVDIRIIAATNRSVQDLQARFRSDFYGRLVQHCILVPSLRDRWTGESSGVVEADLEEMFDYVIEQMNRNPRHKRRLKMERSAVKFARQLVDEYLDGGNNIFEGNIRTLRNLIERAYERAQYDGSAEVGLGHVISTLGMIKFMNVQAGAKGEPGSIERTVGSLRMEHIERQAIVEALARAENNLTRAADILGMHRDTLRRKIADYGI